MNRKMNAGTFPVIITLFLLLCVHSVVAEDILAQYAAVPITGPAPLTVHFVDQSEGNPTSWQWDLTGDGIIDVYDDPNPVWTYTTPNTYTISLVVENYTGVPSHTIGGSIVVTEPVPEDMVPMFAAAPRFGYAPLNVSFIDQSAGGIIEWNWTFGDDTDFSERHEQNPWHVYKSPGWYSVELNVSNGDSWSNPIIMEKMIQVMALPPPQADFSAVPVFGNNPLNVSFIALTNSEENLQYLWDFGDHTLQEKIRNPVHTYLNPGLYNVSLGVTGSGGTTVIRKDYYVAVATPPVFSADFAAAPANGTAPLAVTFISHTNSSERLRYEWDFGDKTKAKYEVNPVHVYDEPGVYTVTLNVSNGMQSNMVKKEACVVVRPSPVSPVKAMFSASPRKGEAPLGVYFFDQSLGMGNLSWQWDFGDHTLQSHEKNPYHVYDKTGKYNVSMMISDNFTTDIIRQDYFIEVTDPVPPQAEFSMVPQSGSAPLTVHFLDQSIGKGPFSYHWEFGDGNESFIKNPVYIYNQTGKFSVNLTIRGPTGSSMKSIENAVSAPIYGDGPLTANFSAVSTRGVAPFEVQFLDLSNGKPSAWKWLFGDGAAINEQGPNYTYLNPGIYDVQLDVYNNTGASDRIVKRRYITALSPTVTSQFGYNYADLNNLRSLQFYDNSVGVGINQWNWNFDDGPGSVSTIQNPIYTYTRSGVYNVQLTVSNGYATNTVTNRIGIT